MFKNKNNINSRFYLKENKSKSNPKFVFLQLLKILKKNKKKFKRKLVFTDIGCGNGALISFLSDKINHWDFIGTENEKDFIDHCKKNIKNSNFFLDDLRNNPKKKFPLGDVVNLSGVHSHFDDPKIYINGAIKRCNNKGQIIIHGMFNPHNIDVVTRYKKSEDYNYIENKVDQTGWNMFSIKTITNILKHNESVNRFNFIKIDFPPSLKIKIDNKNLIRSWNQKFNNKNYFINGLNIVQHQYFLIIDKK